MIAFELAREPSGFAFRFRFERLGPRRALALVAYASLALFLIALGQEPLRSTPLPRYRAALASPTTVVLRPVRPLVTLDRSDPSAVRDVLVGSDDTLFSLADRYGITPQTIAFNNDIADSAELRAGALLHVPTIDAALYEVREGDTVESVAAHFGAAADAVASVNRLLFEPENFSPGRAIVVPVPEGRFPDFRLKVSDESRPAAVARTFTRGRLVWPVQGVVTQGFTSYHTGVDIAAPFGTAVASAEAGTVEAVGSVAGGGLRVCVRHDWGLRTCYYHLSATEAVEGQRVSRGQVLGRIGLTGVTTGPHVHWEASVAGAFLDPLSY